MSSGASWRHRRRPALDGLRGIAVLLVLVGHIDDQFAAAAVFGVSVFFGLSGFLITALLLEEGASAGSVSIRAFYGRRARRLLPALAPVMVVAAALELSFGWSPIPEATVVLTYTSNWAAAFDQPMTLLGHTWSLAVEEQFYLLWPFVVAVGVARRLTSRRFAAWCLAGAVVSFVSTLVLWRFGASGGFLGTSTITRADSLLVGCAFAAALHGGWRPRVGAMWALAGMATAVGAAGWFIAAPVGLVVPSAGTIAAVPVLVGTLSEPRVLMGRVMRWFGRRSYALYLWHYPLLVSTHWGAWSVPIWVDVLLTFVLAEASWWLIERPMQRRGSERRGQERPRLEVAEVDHRVLRVQPDVLARLPLGAADRVE